MPNILTAAESAVVLRTTVTDAAMLALLPQVDAYLKRATGHDWTSDTAIRDEAKSAAQMLLVMWYENPAMTASGVTTLSFGLQAALMQLKAIALSYREFAGRDGAGGITLSSARIGDTVSTLVGIIGVSGDQSASFEAVITVDDQIQQVSASDLSANWYRAFITPPGEL